MTAGYTHHVQRVEPKSTVTVLPIHDAIIVPALAVDKAKRVMLRTFEVQTGQKGQVEEITPQKLEEKLQPELPLVA